MKLYDGYEWCIFPISVSGINNIPLLALLLHIIWGLVCWYQYLIFLLFFFSTSLPTNHPGMVWLVGCANFFLGQGFKGGTSKKRKSKQAFQAVWMGKRAYQPPLLCICFCFLLFCLSFYCLGGCMDTRFNFEGVERDGWMELVSAGPVMRVHGMGVGNTSYWGV